MLNHIKKPLTTNKSNKNRKIGKYIFYINKKINKNFIKRYIIKFWNIKIKKINIINNKKYISYKKLIITSKNKKIKNKKINDIKKI